jgi:hypothetical protein
MVILHSHIILLWFNMRVMMTFLFRTLGFSLSTPVIRLRRALQGDSHARCPSADCLHGFPSLLKGWGRAEGQLEVSMREKKEEDIHINHTQEGIGHSHKPAGQGEG